MEYWRKGRNRGEEEMRLGKRKMGKEGGRWE